MVLGLSPHAQAADFTVTNLSDGPAPGPAGSLRKAVSDANASSGDDRVLFDSSLSGAIFLSNGQMSITENLDIEGPGAVIYGPAPVHVSAGFSSRIFFVDQADAQINGLLLSTGAATTGGAIYADGGDVAVFDSLINGNRATAGNGGAIAANNGSVDLYGSTVNGNRATGEGGAIWSDELITIDGSTISGNAAGGSGGGVAGTGVGGAADIYASTLSGNISANLGGGLYAPSGGPGGANIYDSTIFGNSAFGGGGVSVFGGLIMNTIVAGNRTVPQNHGGDADVHGVFEAGYSLFQESAAASIDPIGPNITGVDPQLGPLALNGGPTETHRPSGTSAAIDRGSALDPVDQRGQLRPLDIPWVGNASGGDGSDIGAVELTLAEGPAAPATPSTNPCADKTGKALKRCRCKQKPTKSKRKKCLRKLKRASRKN